MSRTIGIITASARDKWVGLFGNDWCTQEVAGALWEWLGLFGNG